MSGDLTHEVVSNPSVVSRVLGVSITALAELPPGTLVDERRLAAILGVTPRTVRRMVDRYELPPPIRNAGRSMWIVGRVVDYLNAAADREEREQKRRADEKRELKA